ncbi:TRAP transporter small permease [Salinisphaera sp. T31B1]|uniref:TRAP transporter small permease n=1 Tax=Salinisphaera sp. T31B1 TaxID=727963 RepID=UPI00334126C7
MGLIRLWNRLEEALVVFFLTGMTLVTFAYVAVTNLYGLFYDLGDAVPSLETPAFAVGDFLLTLGQQMTWSLAVTTTLFAWLIFIGIAYCVREGAHIGVDLLVRLFPERLQRVFGVVACLIFIGYAGLLMVSSFTWLQSLMVNNIGAEDLDAFGIKEWHVALVEPIGMALVIARLLEVMVHIVRGRQLGLERSNEAGDALSLMERELENSRQAEQAAVADSASDTRGSR